MEKYKRILIIVPAFNEEGNIQKTVEEIFALNRSDVSVLVVDDGSFDETFFKACQTKGFVISHPFNLGIGGTVQTGFKFAKEKNFDYAVQVDGDGQHDVCYLETILNPLLNNEADVVIGSRFLPPHLGYQSSFVRRIGIHFFARLISFLTDYKVTDPTSGFRAYNRKMIDVFAEYYPQDFPEPEAIAVASRYQARVVEVAVQMRERTEGNSSIRYLKTLYYMIKVTFAIVLDKLKPKSHLRSGIGG
ncbi:Glycosyltransferase involved in cell wall biogenesis [hydrothermal vent metagenome]|uniref:Glycosyltransferase involved in cell wall biogenesis n=1 Tax=hydrothermal vent metagenome TaxID=652676 RepID=A0A3B1DDG5_9ZZZZ